MTALRPTSGGYVTIAVTSGKGGVGKTHVAVNLAVALARLRHRVAILDADLGLGNADVLLGLAPSGHLGHVLAGERTLEEVMIAGPLGVRLIPASSGQPGLTALSPRQWSDVTIALRRLDAAIDFLLVDTAAGISGNVFGALALADRVLVVTCLEPSAVVDAYAMIKLLSAHAAPREIGILVNSARDASEAQLVFAQLEVAATRFLNRRLVSYGYIPYDGAVRESVLMQRAVVDHLPQAAASRSFRILASRVAGEYPHGRSGLHLVSALGAVAPDVTNAEASPCP